MANFTARTARAAALHRQAAAAVSAAATALDTTRPVSADHREQQLLAARLTAAAAVLAPGWLGEPLHARSAYAPTAGHRPPTYVRIGTAQPLDDARFPAIVPLLGAGHLTIDADARDVRVAGLLRSLLLRLLAAAPAGSLLVRGVDATGPKTVFAPFDALADAGLMPPAATDRTGLQAVLAEAERWVRPTHPTAARHRRRDRTLLLVIASMPELTDAADLGRIGALAQHGPEAGLHLVIAGWPPPPLTAEISQPPLPAATPIAVRNPYALLGDPPGASFACPAPSLPSTGLNSPVLLDEEPSAALVERVCRELAAQFVVDSRPSVVDLLPDESDGLWTEDAAEGLTTVVGHDGETPVTLRLNDLTPHWLIGGRSGGGKSAFLVNVLYGLCARYRPEDLVIRLADLGSGDAFTEFLPTARDRSWLPHVRSAGVAADREYGLSLLRELDAELDRRVVAFERAGVSRLVDLTGPDRLPRLLCVLEAFPVLLGGRDRLAREALTVLESVSRRGRSYGVHLVLTGRPLPGPPGSPFAAVLGQFPVRIALPGGDDVLEPTNDSAAGLPVGAAVVNTAGGLGGPRGATRGHERIVRFPDPAADGPALTAVRNRLWLDRSADTLPPLVFAGSAAAVLSDDPAYRALLAETTGPGIQTEAPSVAGPEAQTGTGDRPKPDTRAATGVGTQRGTRSQASARAQAKARPGARTAADLRQAHPRQADAPPAAPDPTASGSTRPDTAAATRPGTGRSSARLDAPAVALLGRTVDVRLTTAGFPLDMAPGRHLAIVGPGTGGAEVLASAALAVAAGYPPGATRFVVASLAPETEAVADRLVTALRTRHEVDSVDATGLAKELDGDRPSYLVVFGMDAATPADLPADQVRAALRDGPGRGVHLLSWWRRARRLADLVAGGTPGEHVAGILLVDAPASDAVQLIGRDAGWQPRPGRAILYDLRRASATLLVPFTRPGGAP